MKSLKHTIIAATAALATAGGASAGVTPAFAAADPSAQLITAVYNPAAPVTLEKTAWFWGGYNYCWYAGGWRGPGYYWCGYAWRRGFGWGGPIGWHGWGGGGWRGGGWRGGWHGGGWRGGWHGGGHGGWHGGGHGGWHH
jgi:hypothetical protein